ncbi:MAG: helix-turn-helix domain-containing protein [Nitrospinae bacterium]|nr:helix-turn-helix domain-containing protein [Nitrospinota bacterium]MCG2813568.1 helix-turn-helix domain-containing protein [Thermodesulfovibrionales bacterium]
MKRRDRNIIGENIRKLRMQTGLTQEELALKSGLSQGYVNQLENGKRKYTQKSLELIADALAIPVAEMFKEEGEQIDVVSKGIAQYKKKRPDKKEFLALLNELPEHIVEHYLVLLRLEKKIQNGEL